MGATQSRNHPYGFDERLGKTKYEGNIKYDQGNGDIQFDLTPAELGFQQTWQGPQLIPVICACGTVFTDDAVYCRHCGAPRGQAEALAALAREKAMLGDVLDGASGPAADKAAEDAARAQAAAKGLADKADDLAREAALAQQQAAQAKEQEANLAKDLQAEAQHLGGITGQLRAQAEAAANNAREKDLIAQQLKDALRKAKDEADREAAEAARLAREAQKAKDLRMKMFGNNPDREAQALAKANELGPRAQQLADAARRAAEDADRAKQLADSKKNHARDIDSQFRGVRDRAAAARQEASDIAQSQNEEQKAKELDGVARAARADAAQLRARADQLAALAEMAARQARFAEKNAKDADDQAKQADGRARELTDHARRIAANLQLPDPSLSARVVDDANNLANQANQLGPLADAAKADANNADADAAAKAARAKELAMAAAKAQEEARPWLEAAQEISDADALGNLAPQAANAANNAKLRAQQLADQAAAADRDAANAHNALKPLMDNANGAEMRLNQINSQLPQLQAGVPSPAHQAAEQRAKHANDLLNAAQKARDDADKARAQAQAEAERAKNLRDMLEKKKEEEERLRPSMCVCGNHFLPDSIFCRKCGRPRNQTFAWDSVSPSSLAAGANVTASPGPATRHISMQTGGLPPTTGILTASAAPPATIKTLVPQPMPTQAIPVEPMAVGSPRLTAAALFEQLDKNKDGVITRAELQAALAGQTPSITMNPIYSVPTVRAG